MVFTYHRAGRISLLPALAVGAAVAILAGVATVTLLTVGVAVTGVRLLRAIGRRGPAGRSLPAQDPTTIEGVVVNSTDVRPATTARDRLPS